MLDATEQLMKRPNLTTMQRRVASKAKLLERGEVLIIKKQKPDVGPNAESRMAKRPKGTCIIN